MSSNAITKAGATTAVVVGAGQVGISVFGGSAAAVSAATVIAATGGAVAVVFVGYGFYKWLSSSSS
jgi:GMP synthase PP-ATPase subunit